MRFFKKNSESLVALLLLLVIFVSGWQLINHFFHNEVVAQQETYLKKKGELLIRQLQSESLVTFPSIKKQDTPADLALPVAAVELLENYVVNSSERVTLLNGQGEILFDTADEQLQGERNDRPEVQSVLSGSAVGSALRDSVTLKEELLYTALPIKDQKEILGVLRLAEPTSVFLQQAAGFRRSILIVFILFFVIITSLVLYLIRQKNRPIETVLPVLKRMVRQPAQVGVIMQDSDEWAELYRTINTLSEQMSETYLAYTATEEQFYTLLNELMIGVFIIDEEGKFVLVNPKMQEHLAMTEFVPGQLYTETLTDTQLIRLIHQVTSEQPVVHEELQIKEPYEQVLSFSLRYLTQASKNQIIGLAYDLTRVRRLEKMQKDFVGNVSHELKTPVTSLIGFTETLLDGAMDDPTTLKEFLQIMQKDAQRLQKLIQEIIQLSKDGESVAYETQKIAVQPLLTQLIQSYQGMLKEKEVQIELIGIPTLEIETKMELFYPIIKNLVENAIQYSPEKRTIRITYEQQATFILAVQDYGIGIDEEDQERIFERFYRVDKARSRHSGGTGLGLSIVRDYTRLLGGSVSVDSHLGLGSTFTIHLPIEKGLTQE
ncbi:two-component sensor histidine kinase [Enterococcus sp. JM4C]|uniref:sensor histidine kinase n=1 Tax=Candidatus Enterococcus huntleyi TaxID=1857217 RepID=UPI001379CE59|nr:ATP-binding protein [Enterococcus sp. JM4C]KAF1297575.1 two-component sensor histidine kinase [Enterococcus sp. JM4C]